MVISCNMSSMENIPLKTKYSAIVLTCSDQESARAFQAGNKLHLSKYLRVSVYFGDCRDFSNQEIVKILVRLEIYYHLTLALLPLVPKILYEK